MGCASVAAYLAEYTQAASCRCRSTTSTSCAAWNTENPFSRLCRLTTGRPCATATAGLRVRVRCI